jgi:integrase/recombinase XerC
MAEVREQAASVLYQSLLDTRLEEILRVAATTGDDRALDALLLRLHTETACRRGGALALMPEDLDAEHCLIRLHEKGETVRWQPVSPTLMSHLLAHGKTRGGLAPGRPLLRYATGKPITSRRYDYLWRRLGLCLPWVATQQVSMHWIRHTTLTWVERNFGFATAQAYAGHEDHGRGGKTIATYVRAGLPEVATALAALTGEPHPLAINPPHQARRSQARRNEANMSPANEICDSSAPPLPRTQPGRGVTHA